MTEIHEMEDWIQLFDGTQLFFMVGPQKIADVVTIEQIAHGLGMLCRYAGQCDGFYSVAEHSALMAHWVFQRTTDRQLALAALLHDATEAFLPDVPRPIKVHLPDYYDMEARLMQGIMLKFDLQGISVVGEYGRRKVCLAPIVGEADNRILVDEKAAIMTQGDHVWASDCLEPLGVDIKCLSPADAKAFFLQTYEVFKD